MTASLAYGSGQVEGELYSDNVFLGGYEVGQQLFITLHGLIFPLRPPANHLLLLRRTHPNSRARTTRLTVLLVLLLSSSLTLGNPRFLRQSLAVVCSPRKYSASNCPPRLDKASCTLEELTLISTLETR